MKTDFKKKYFKLKKEYKDLLKFHEIISEFQGTAIVENKINLSHQDMSQVLSNVMNLDKSIKKSNKINKGCLKRLYKIVKGLYYKYKYYLKYTKFRAFMLYIKILLTITMSSNIIYALYSKVMNGEFSLDLFLVVGQLILSMF